MAYTFGCFCKHLPSCKWKRFPPSSLLPDGSQSCQLEGFSGLCSAAEDFTFRTASFCVMLSVLLPREETLANTGVYRRESNVLPTELHTTLVLLNSCRGINKTASTCSQHSSRFSGVSAVAEHQNCNKDYVLEVITLINSKTAFTFKFTQYNSVYMGV